ncbi:hypothetical protein PoB_004738100 [Plakobranchus ocellatus]|uniref:Uncharacterized protein n=1 Tax=Plakobranchus ocellatus TaxID=259542 RepID=A0AAV4BBZ1_9GAST|nr:hypothetical protein PoB_004738100 [Plakobranchus ocellatus]
MDCIGAGDLVCSTPDGEKVILIGNVLIEGILSEITGVISVQPLYIKWFAWSFRTWRSRGGEESDGKIYQYRISKAGKSLLLIPQGVGGTVPSESALIFEGILLSRVRAPPPVLRLTNSAYQTILCHQQLLWFSNRRPSESYTTPGLSHELPGLRGSGRRRKAETRMINCSLYPGQWSVRLCD